MDMAWRQTGWHGMGGQGQTGTGTYMTSKQTTQALRGSCVLHYFFLPFFSYLPYLLSTSTLLSNMMTCVCVFLGQNMGTTM